MQDDVIPEARLLQRILKEVDDDLEYYELVAAYRRIGSSLS